MKKTNAAMHKPDKKIKRQKREKPGFHDDGRVLADMNVEGFNWYDPTLKGDKAQKKDIDKPSKKEIRAIIRAQLQIILPRMLIIIVSFLVVMLLCTLWLNS